jgi:hypothetical protein
METVGEGEPAPVALPESVARCFGEVIEVNPIVGPGAGIAREVRAPVTSIVMFLAEQPVGIIYVRPPECRLSGGRINRQSNLPTALELHLVLLKIGFRRFAPLY